MEDAPREGTIGITEVFEQLPLFRSLYLYMQLQNIDIVDSYLERLEADLLREYISLEHLSPSFVFVSAISQLWVFGIYELLRTWRQWIGELITYGEELEELSKEPKGEEARVRRIEDRVARDYSGKRLRHQPEHQRGLVNPPLPRQPIFPWSSRRSLNSLSISKRRSRSA